MANEPVFMSILDGLFKKVYVPVLDNLFDHGEDFSICSVGGKVYSDYKPKCECGAKHTSNPNYHMNFCPLSGD